MKLNFWLDCIQPALYGYWANAQKLSSRGTLVGFVFSRLFRRPLHFFVRSSSFRGVCSCPFWSSVVPFSRTSACGLLVLVYWLSPDSLSCRDVGPTLALFRSLCNKRQLSRKNKFDKLSGMFPTLVFVAF